MLLLLVGLGGVFLLGDFCVYLCGLALKVDFLF